MTADILQLIRNAIAEPGRYVERADGGRELATFWQARAVHVAAAAYTREAPAAAELRKVTALAKSRATRIEGLEAQMAELRTRIAELVPLEAANKELRGRVGALERLADPEMTWAGWTL